MPNPTTVREILARALTKPGPYVSQLDVLAKYKAAKRLLELLAAAGLPDESQLDALLRGEAVVVNKEQQLAEVQDAYSTGYGDACKPRLRKHGWRDPDASQESGDARQEVVRKFNEWVPGQESGE